MSSFSINHLVSSPQHTSFVFIGRKRQIFLYLIFTANKHQFQTPKNFTGTKLPIKFKSWVFYRRREPCLWENAEWKSSLKEKQLIFRIRDSEDLIFFYLLMPQIEQQESEAREIPLSHDKAVYLLLEVCLGEWSYTTRQQACFICDPCCMPAIMEPCHIFLVYERERGCNGVWLSLLDLSDPHLRIQQLTLWTLRQQIYWERKEKYC